MGKSSVVDARTAARHQGKLFTALPVLISVLDATTFPVLGDCVSLNGQNINIPNFILDHKMRATLVTLCFSNFSAVRQ